MTDLYEYIKSVSQEIELEHVKSLSDDELMKRAWQIWGEPVYWNWDMLEQVDDYSWKCTTNKEFNCGWKLIASGYTCGNVLEDYTVEWTAPDGRTGQF